MLSKDIRSKLLLFIPILLAALAIATWWWTKPEPLPEGLIQANGRIEGDRYTVASKVSGKVVEIKVREGDFVKKGQVLVLLDDTQIKAKVEQAKAAVKTFSAQLESTKGALHTLKKQVPLEIEAARAGVTHAKAALVAAKAREKQAYRDAKRFRTLMEKGTVDKRSAEQAELAWKVAKSDRLAAEAALIQANKQLDEAQLGWDRIKVKEDEVLAIEAQLERARAAWEEAQSLLNDLTILAPAAGIITTKIVEEGEVISAGSPLVDIVDFDSLYLKVYIPEKEIGKVRLGLPARIYTDAFPDEPFPATVRYIASRAEFTPKEVQTPEERVKIVYAVKLYLGENPDHRLTPGLPADAVIRWKEETPWAKPRW